MSAWKIFFYQVGGKWLFMNIVEASFLIRIRKVIPLCREVKSWYNLVIHIYKHFPVVFKYLAFSL